MFLLAVLILVATRVLPAAMRGLRQARRGDVASAVMALAAGGLPAAEEEWGQAMRAEFEHLTGSDRRRFSLGCAWAAGVIRSRRALVSRERGGGGLRAVVLAGIAAALGLIAYGLVRYPGLRAGTQVWGSIALFVLVLLVYAAATLLLSRGESSDAVLARRYGLAGGLMVGAAWLAALAPPHWFKAWVAVPLVVALLGPALVAGLAGRRHRDRRIGTRAALWTGIVGALGVFVVWVSSTYANAGRPYDAGLRRDFQHSHARDLATYAISDNLGSALALLVLIPTLALAIGSLTARVAAAGERSLR